MPSEFDPAHRTVTRDVAGVELWRDPRTQAGDLLFPAKFSREVLTQARMVDLGSYAYSAQHQQRPTPAEGGLIKRAWFARRWVRPGEPALTGFQTRPLPDRFDRLEIFTDAAFKKTDTSDRVAIGVCGTVGPNLFLIDLAWDRMSFIETLQAIRGLVLKYRPQAICVEDKANGSAIIEILKQEIPGVIGIEPEGGKESRIAACSPKLEAGNVWLPQSATWVGAFIEEAASFPKASHDDGIDMLAYAIGRMLVSSELSFLINMASGTR